MALKAALVEEVVTMSDIKEFEVTLKREFTATKTYLLKRRIGLLFLQANFIVTLIKLLKHCGIAKDRTA